MAAVSTTNSTSNSGTVETTVVDEIPDSLNQILLMIVKNFFSNEHYLVVYYIMRAECIREENLKSRLNFDQKQLRQLLATLKAEKLVKERLFSQKNENGRNVSIIFYFINYRSVLNVLKYKIDHMRQKLESREKNDTNKAHYKCHNCCSTYDMLEINGILDFATGRLTCWRCQGEVQVDESLAPSQLTRTAVARFNEQMTPLFSRIQELNGVQLAPHLLEPDITKYLEDDRARELQLQQQSMDFTSNGGGNRVALGAVAHSFQNASTLNYQHGDQITVDLNADINNRPVEEAKAIPMWLQDNAIGGDVSHNEQVLSQVNEPHSSETSNPGLSINLLAEFEGVSKEPEVKKSKTEDNSEENGEKEEENEDEEEEEEEELEVGGRKVAFSEITPDMIENEMSEEERQKYTELVQQLHVY
ncbi:unnamed protein product [Caenorhabditis angaria]|uniref:HTH TFE/IIEalpha-type domain-containing protein n=1 Tax=Caenorhabditis angaria TaxID=860376 RepID=A0A9P1IP26_9PELO|nr:unnamed protein product [Caenorhabditis angaria]